MWPDRLHGYGSCSLRSIREGCDTLMDLVPCVPGVRQVLLVQVRVRNYAEYSSLPKEMALRLVPRDGKTRRGETLLKPYLDADHVDRLCSAFAK